MRPAPEGHVKEMPAATQHWLCLGASRWLPGIQFPSSPPSSCGALENPALGSSSPQKKSPDGVKHTSPGGHPTWSKRGRSVASPQPLWAQPVLPLPLPALLKPRSPPGGRQRQGRGRAAGARLFPPDHPEESPRTHLRAPDPLSRHGSARLGTARGRAAGRGCGCRAPPALLGSAPPSQEAKNQPGMASQGPAVAKDPPCAPPDSPAARSQHPPAAPRPPGVSPSLIHSSASALSLLPLFFPGFSRQNLGSPCQHPGCRPSPEQGARRRWELLLAERHRATQVFSSLFTSLAASARPWHQPC